MKKVLTITIILGLLVFSTSLIAQRKRSKKQTTRAEEIKKEERADSQKKNIATSIVHKSSGIKKDGTPDLRLKANKQTKPKVSRRTSRTTTT